MNLLDNSVRMQGEAEGGGLGARGWGEGGSPVVREAVTGASGDPSVWCAEQPKGLHGASVPSAGSGTSLTRSWEACPQITRRFRAPG